MKTQTKKQNNCVAFKIKLRKNTKAMLSLAKLINASYWQSIFGPVMNYVFPIAFIGLYGLIAKGMNAGAPAAFKSAIIGVVVMQVMSFAINAVPQSINDFKTSVLLKRIGSTPIRPATFLVTVGSYYATLMLISFFWILMWFAIFFNQEIVWIFNGKADGSVLPVQWGGFIFSVFYTVISSIFIGLLVVSLSKSAIGSNVIGMIMFFLSMFLSGMLFPIQNIVSNTALNVLSMLTPFRYTTGLITMSWNGSNVFDLTKDYLLNGQVIYRVYDLYLNLFIPLAFVGLSLFFSAKNFKWNVR